MKKISAAWRLALYDKQWLTVSNMLTLFRLMGAPVVVASLYYQAWTLAGFCFFVAAVTDLLDGHLARAFNQQTHLGTLLDPIADKILLTSSFGALAFFHSPFFHIPYWFFVLVVCREMVMLVGSLILLIFFTNAHMQPMIWGKLTTLLQVLFLLWVFACYFIGYHPETTYSVLLVLLALFSILSLWQYINRAVEDIRS